MDHKWRKFNDRHVEMLCELNNGNFDLLDQKWDLESPYLLFYEQVQLADAQYQPIARAQLDPNLNSKLIKPTLDKTNFADQIRKGKELEMSPQSPLIIGNIFIFINL